MIRTIVVDDQALVRTGFAMILNSQDDIEVVGEAGNGREAIEAVARHQPDVVLMDIRMPEMDGIEATRRLTADPTSAARVLILTTFDTDEYVFRALQAGASGFVLKDIPAEDLAAAVRVLAGGDALLAPSITRRLIAEFAQAAARAPVEVVDLSALTDREQEILGLVGRGLSNAEIADELVIGAATVKSHVSNLLGKLSLRDRVQAVVFAHEHGLMERRGSDH